MRRTSSVSGSNVQLVLVILLMFVFVLHVMNGSIHVKNCTIHVENSSIHVKNSSVHTNNSSIHVKNSSLHVNNGNSITAMTGLEAPPTERVHRPIFYMKMHKTASTTIANALGRYARRHGLSISNAPGRNYITKPNPSSDRFDVIAFQHMPYNLEVLDTFLNARPKLVLSSVRQPTDRTISWFRQQITDFESVSQQDCPTKEKAILEEFDEFVKKGRLQASQFFQLQERTARLALDPQKMNLTQVVSQYNFIFLQERLKDSFECFCKTHGIHLCDEQHPVKKENVKKKQSCVEHVLVRHRLSVLTKGYEEDVQVLEWVRQQLDECTKEIPSHCRCGNR